MCVVLSLEATMQWQWGKPWTRQVQLSVMLWPGWIFGIVIAIFFDQAQLVLCPHLRFIGGWCVSCFYTTSKNAGAVLSLTWHFGNLLLQPKLFVWVCYRGGRKVTSSIIAVWVFGVAEQLSLSLHPTHRWRIYMESCCFEQTYNGFSRWDQTIPDPSIGFLLFHPNLIPSTISTAAK